MGGSQLDVSLARLRDEDADADPAAPVARFGSALMGGD
jgi:hypothetical protein